MQPPMRKRSALVYERACGSLFGNSALAICIALFGHRPSELDGRITANEVVHLIVGKSALVHLNIARIAGLEKRIAGPATSF